MRRVFLNFFCPINVLKVPHNLAEVRDDSEEYDLSAG
jgi:hypothetical protein